LVQVLAGTEHGLVGVVGDVSSQVLELFGRSNQMVKALLVPEASFVPNARLICVAVYFFHE